MQVNLQHGFSPKQRDRASLQPRTAVLLDGKVIGVIQISRKGANPHGAGPDFTAEDVGRILALCKPLGKLVQRAAGE